MLRTSIVISSECSEFRNADLYFTHPRCKGYFRSRLCVFFLNLCGLSAFIHEEVNNDL